MTPFSWPVPVARVIAAAVLLGACAAEPDESTPDILAPEPSYSSAELAMTQGFRKQVTVAGIREHQAAFQQFADQAGGHRALGTSGYDASAQYVFQRMTSAGYDTRVETFPFNFQGDVRPPILQQTSPQSGTYTPYTDFTTMSYSGNGDVTAPLYAVGFEVPVGVPDISTSGCEAADFAGFTPGNIALLQRGTCTFQVKADNALAAGAAGVIVANDGQPFRTTVVLGTLQPVQASLPVVGATFALGETLRGTVADGPTGVTVRLAVQWVAETRTGRNVIAESRGGNPTGVVVVGAALDGSLPGPAINRASGAATTLEIAEVFASQQRSSVSRLRFIWFGGTGPNRLGAASYLAGLSAEGRSRIKAMLDFQELGSPNFGRFVYDGDNSDVSSPIAPSGSGTLERVFSDYFSGVALSAAPLSDQSVSDRNAFIGAGTPVGGLFAGSVDVKTAGQEALFGGVAGQSYDPCAGLQCDAFANVSLTALDQLSDAAAHAVLLLAKRNLAKHPL